MSIIRILVRRHQARKFARQLLALGKSEQTTTWTLKDYRDYLIGATVVIGGIALVLNFIEWLFFK